jgi:small redox-active disulfide protein 2
MKKLQVLGPGCPKCEKLMENTRAAAAQLELECEIEKVSKLTEIAAFGVMITPALVVDGEVKVSGKVPDVDQIKELLTG